MYSGVWGDPRYPDSHRDPLKVALFTEPLSPRAQRAWQQAVTVARSYEPRLREPYAVQTNRFFDYSVFRWFRSPIAQIEKATNIVILDPVRTAGLKHDELVCVFGHEIGHAVWRDVFGEADAINVRRGAVIRHLHEEEFADLFGRSVCGADAWNRTTTRLGITRRMFDER